MPRPPGWSRPGEKARCDASRGVRQLTVNYPQPTEVGESMRRLLGRRSLAGLAAAATICGGLAACSSSPNSQQNNSGTTPTLVMESSPETSITQAFNPFVATQAAYGMGATGPNYEPPNEIKPAAPPKDHSW